jgi:hypothetical protein
LEIKAATDIQTAPALPINDYKNRLVKLIPLEIITAFVALKGLINGECEMVVSNCCLDRVSNSGYIESVVSPLSDPV